MKRYRELVNEAAKSFAELGIEEAENDAKELMMFLMNWDYTHYTLCIDDESTKEAVDKYAELVEKRKTRIPVQLIIGEAPFYGRQFKVTQGTLIPRFDTEILVEEVISYIKKKYPSGEARVLDMCTGTGCIAITIDQEVATKKVVAADISEKALEVARENARKNGSRAELIRTDLFEGINEEFDVLVSNPPYIPTKVIDTLQPEVKNNDPHLALDGGEDGLDIYRRIIQGINSKNVLSAGGAVFFEIGYDQGKAVSGLLEKAGFSKVRVIKDLAGLDRALAAEKI